jgi:tRNA threonylcarbamoyladenosine biosynthesis protein TsaB
VIVLGFDTATASTAVALRLADGSMLQARDDPAPQGHPGHATRLLEMAGGLLAQEGLRWGAIERLAVGVGPGRFTGLRVGIATARGIAQSLGAELVGVSSLRSLALAAEQQADDRGVLAVIDARRGEAFAAAYPVVARGASAGAGSAGASESDAPSAAAASEVVFPRALGPAELEGVAGLIERHGGPSGQRWLAVGDGALHFRAELERSGAVVPDEDSPLHLVDPRAVCELAAWVKAVEPLAQILPDYRRSPDAALAQRRDRPLTLGGARS